MSLLCLLWVCSATCETWRWWDKQHSPSLRCERQALITNCYPRIWAQEKEGMLKSAWFCMVWVDGCDVLSFGLAQFVLDFRQCCGDCSQPCWLCMGRTFPCEVHKRRTSLPLHCAGVIFQADCVGRLQWWKSLFFPHSSCLQTSALLFNYFFFLRSFEQRLSKQLTSWCPFIKAWGLTP